MLTLLHGHNPFQLLDPRTGARIFVHPMFCVNHLVHGCLLGLVSTLPKDKNPLSFVYFQVTMVQVRFALQWVFPSVESNGWIGNDFLRDFHHRHILDHVSSYLYH